MTAPLRIVIADDDRFSREMLHSLLGRLGHEVVGVAESGQSLVAQCSVLRPDIAITDNFMSDMTGLDAAAQIHEEWPLPIILISAYCDPNLVREAEEKRVLVYLVKPISQEHLEVALLKCHEQLQEMAPFTTQRTGEVTIEPVHKVETDSRRHVY